MASNEIGIFSKALGEISTSRMPHSGRELDQVVVRCVLAEQVHSASFAAIVVPKLAETK